VLRYLSDDSQDSDFEFNVINIRFYITKGYQCRINLSSAVVLGLVPFGGIRGLKVKGAMCVNHTNETIVIK